MKTTTISDRRGARRHLVVVEYPEGVQRPHTRGDCELPHGVRPCPWVSCRHHLALDVTPFGSVRIDRRALEDMPETCALDAARHEHTLEEIGDITGLSRERVRQIEQAALAKVVAAAKSGAIADTREEGDER